MRTILTVDVGGTFIKYAFVTGIRSFKIIKRNKILAPKKSHEEFLNCLADIFNSYDNAEGIAVSMPGLIDTNKGVCISSASFNFSNGHCIAEELQDMCGGVRVTVENDANCAALAELKSGSLATVRNAFILVFGTSVGGTFICNRNIYRGANNCAGEVAFTLNGAENFYGNEISALAFQKNCADILGMPVEEISGEMIFNLIKENDEDVLNALREYAHKVAIKIFNLQMLFDPELFALGGGISAQQIFIDTVQAKVNEISANALDYLPRPKVVACKYRNDANLLGALYRYLKR